MRAPNRVERLARTLILPVLLGLFACEGIKDAAKEAGLSTSLSYSFSGVVRNMKGEPIEGATVDFIKIDSLDKLKQIGKNYDEGERSLEINLEGLAQAEAAYSAKTTSSGSYELTEMELGVYFARVSGPEGAQPAYDFAFGGFDAKSAPAKLKFDENLYGFELAKKVESGSMPSLSDLKFSDVNFTLVGGPQPLPEPAKSEAEPGENTGTATAGDGDEDEGDSVPNRQCNVEPKNGEKLYPLKIALEWDHESDMKLMVFKFLLSDVRTHKTATAPVDSYTWMHPQGSTGVVEAKGKIVPHGPDQPRSELFVIEDISDYANLCYVVGAQYLAGSVQETSRMKVEMYDAAKKILTKAEVDMGTWTDAPGLTGQPATRTTLLMAGDLDCRLLFQHTQPVDKSEEDVGEDECK